MTAAIILAAGGSSRLGQPKQNLKFNGQTLLQRAVNSALQSKCKLIIVVLGANADEIVPPAKTTLLYNKNWQEGMASSIRLAINEVNHNHSIRMAIIVLCDQPFVSAELLDSMIDKQTETSRAIVACTYEGTIGVPALFERALFEELLLLKGNQGAKKILNDHLADIALISFEQGGIDIDTPGDYERLQRDRGR